MDENFDFSSVGGVPIMQGDGSILWNFGVLQGPEYVRSARDGVPYLYDAFPALRGKWDGKSTVNAHEAVRRVLKRDLKAHKQPRGTCGGRAGSRTLELLQCNLIASGKRAKYHDVSHAWLYYLARREGGMLGGGDGVPGWSIGSVLEKFGALHRKESGDAEQAGPGSDDLAVKWGAGRISSEERAKFEKLAEDNLVTARVRARSAQEMADGLAGGGIVLCSDMQGWTMTRDRHGFCRPQGQWAHYHVRSGVRVAENGEKGFTYDQSWGDDTPGGPLVPGCPGNCFLTPWDEEDRLARRDERDVIFAFDLWDLEEGNVDLDWIF